VLQAHHPDHLNLVYFNEGLEKVLVHLAMIKLSAGDSEGARRAARQLREVAGPKLRAHPELRHILDWKIMGLLIESYLKLKDDSLKASLDADEAARALEGLRPPLLHQERFELGVAHALLYAAGRPAADGRAAECPRLPEHAERAIAELTAADRMGFRYPWITALVNEILDHRSEIQLLLMNQVFPANPFQPVDASDETP
jgi:hypothetical protein